MRKFLYAIIIIILIVFAAPVMANASDMEMKNWQQDETVVPGYVHGDQVGTWRYKVYGGGNFGDMGCGIMSLVNAVHYATGTFMDPLEIADWAHDFIINGNRTFDGAYGTIMDQFYPYVGGQFGEKYGFKIVNTGTYGKVTDAKFINHLKNGGTAVVYVEGHFMAVVDYNVATQKYLLWDNCAGDGRGGHRAGATHIAGDWMTASELEGRINPTYLTVRWYCLIADANAPRPYKETTTRSNLTLAFSEKLASGNISDTTSVTLSDSKGMTLTAAGWHGSTKVTRKYGYSVDGGIIIYDNAYYIAPDNTVQNAAVKALGEGAFASKFSISIPLSDNKPHTYKLYVNDGTNVTCIWTIKKAMTASLSETTPFTGSVKPFTAEGTKYAIRIFQNGAADSSYVNGWGGTDGISNKTLSKDATLYVFGALNLNSKDCRRIGFLVDNSYIIWPDDNLMKSAKATRTDCYIGMDESLGSHGFMFDLSFNTSKLKAGNHVLKLIMDVGDSFVEIGTRSPNYGGGCFIINATSSGAQYVNETPAPKTTPKATPKTTPKTTPVVTPHATAKATDAPKSTLNETPEVTLTPSATFTPNAIITPKSTPAVTSEVVPEMTPVSPTFAEEITEAPVNTAEVYETPDNSYYPDNSHAVTKSHGCGSVFSCFVIVLLAGVTIVSKKKD